jgi:hypothetical protein
MTSKYESPELKVLGSVVDLTQSKPGIFFDGAGEVQGNTDPPPPGTPGTS